MYLTFKIKYMGGIIWANVDKVLLIKKWIFYLTN